MATYTGITHIGRINVGLDNPRKGTSQRGWRFRVHENILITGLRMMTGTTAVHNIITIYNWDTKQLMVKDIVDSNTRNWNEKDLEIPVMLYPGDYVISAYIWDRGVNAYANLHQEGPNDFSKITFNSDAIEFVHPVAEDFGIQGYDYYPGQPWLELSNSRHVYEKYSSEDVDTVLSKIKVKMPMRPAQFLSGIPDFTYEVVDATPVPSTPVTSTPVPSTPIV